MFSTSKRLSSLAATAATVIVTVGAAHAAVITPVGSTDLPVSNPNSVFDCSNAGNAYDLGPGTAFIPEGFDVRDLFGGSFGTYPEPSDVLFENYQGQGNVSTVNVTLAEPVSLTNFNLYLADDGPITAIVAPAG